MPDLPVSETTEHIPGIGQWRDACLAIELAEFISRSKMARGFPSFHVRSHAGPVLDRWIEHFRNLFTGADLVKLPANADIEQLTGGLDLTATMAAGKPVYAQGMLDLASDIVVLVPLANLIEPDLAFQVSANLDQSPGNGAKKFGFVLIDESEDSENEVPACLSDRAMFHLDLRNISYRATQQISPATVKKAFSEGYCNEEVMEEICVLAGSLGLNSARPGMQTVKVACASAASEGRIEVEEEDVLAAVRLSLLNRATVFPESQPEEDEQSEASDQHNNSEAAQTDSTQTLPDDLEVEAQSARLPAELLSRLAAVVSNAKMRAASGKNGRAKLGSRRGRPLASKRGQVRRGQRIDLVASMRAAVPWQTLRNKSGGLDQRIRILPSDIHVRRYKEKTEASTIFVVDASGSTAISRLGEAKGAVEQLLAESYATRDHVSLICFRKNGAELLLPPTRSLARAKRCLSALPGGGGTPLANGLLKALEIANEQERAGRRVSIVLLTDGSANVGLTGESGRAGAMEDALNVAKAVRTEGHAALVIDISKLGNQKAETLSRDMGAQYVPMPFNSANSLASAVKLNR